MLENIFHTYKRSFSGLSRETWLLAGVMLINRAGTMAVPFMSMYVTQALGRSLSEAGWVITLYGAGAVIGAAAGGWLTDRLGFRPVQIASSIVGGALFLFFPFIEDFALLCGLTLVLSAITEAFRPANFTAIASYAKPEVLTRSYSLNRFAINLGWAMGGSLGGLVAAYDYRLLFAVEALANLAAGLLIWRLLPKHAPRSAPAASERATMPWRDGLFLRFLGLTTAFIMCFFLVFRLVPVFWKTEWALSEAAIGAVLGLNGLIVALFEMNLVNRWEGQRSVMHYIMIACGACAAGYACLLLPGAFPLALAMACMALITLAEMLALPFMNAFVMKRASEHNRGQYAAGYALTWSVAQIVGPWAGAAIADKGGYHALWWTLIAAMGCCAWGFGRLQRSIDR